MNSLKYLCPGCVENMLFGYAYKTDIFSLNSVSDLDLHDVNLLACRTNTIM